MTDVFDGLFDRFDRANAGFERRLRLVRTEQWAWPTPCPDWDVRRLVNHMARGNLDYARLVQGGSAGEFLRLRDADALGDDPLGAFARSARTCAAAFAAPGAMDREVDYPLGAIGARQAFAVRITDAAVHTWDLARAIGADDLLDTDLVAWIDAHLARIYATLRESPTSADTTHRFFGAPDGTPPDGASRQARLLHRMGRTDAGAPPAADRADGTRR
ncbi:uncharacterized protein (TIGR03086 family) [Murinocardiopsis flavida]|uniref:Uncharacterized protein (TIGR03086 family) n=1 Tax=Murinocardiopsis flavida TaxID=645275 RepID=A0A2P8DNT8_9ACTN|nr:TIGR03086 family metal-binding protein [Murinocardiopsis flavida]PSK98861.1 uncharacterized protein (TIGR03086 family) [Murinocardiopsis flavida]